MMVLDYGKINGPISAADPFFGAETYLASNVCYGEMYRPDVQVSLLSARIVQIAASADDDTHERSARQFYAALNSVKKCC